MIFSKLSGIPSARQDVALWPIHRLAHEAIE
ncbi:MAG: hypothetical protein QOE56_480 [Solirubrobacterales bacterium]|jgi:hypothetical protein|nr:hypothetical protein [Solirubrobacterales bacterium]